MTKPFCLLLALLLAASGTVLAQPALPADQGAAIERLRDGLERADLDDAGRAEATAALDAATASERIAKEALDAAQTLRETVAAADRERRALQARLNEDPRRAFTDWERRLPGGSDPEPLEALLPEQRTEVARLRAESAQLTAAMAEIDGGGSVGSDDDAAMKLQADDLERRAAAATTAGGDVPAALLQARQLQMRAEQRALLARLGLRELERETAPARMEHLELRLKVAQRELAIHEQRVATLQAMIADRAGSELAELVAQLEADATEFAEADSAVALAAQQNLELGRELAATSQALTALRSEAQAIVEARDQVAAGLANTKARLALDNNSEALGLILLAERRRLQEPEPLQQRLEELREQLAGARLRQIALAETRRALGNVGTAVSHAIDVEEASAEDATVLREQLNRLYGTQAELLPRLETTLQRQVGVLEQAEAALRTAWADTLTLRDLLDRRLFWIPSHARVDFAWIKRQAAGWRDLLKPSRLLDSGRRLADSVFEAPLLPIAGVLLVALLFHLRRRALAKLHALAPPLRRVREDRYRRTGQALLVTIAAAMPWALLCWLFGALLRRAGEPGKYSDSLGQAFIAMAGGVLMVAFLRWMIVDRGLAHLHFRWTRARRESLGYALPWLRWIMLPAGFLAVLAFARGQELAIDTAGRLASVVFALTGAVLLWRLLAAGALWSPRASQVMEPRRLRQLLRVALPALLVALAVAMLGGYVYSGSVIIACLWQTGWTIIAVTLVHGLLSRWFLLGERRLALKRLEAQREAAREAARAEGRDDTGEGPAEIAADELTLEAVNAQTSRLLRAVTLTLWVAGLLWIWADVLPALAALDEVSLWSVDGKAPDGSAIVENVSLKSVLVGLAVLLLTFVAARNLPGLLEIGLLTRISIDAPTRYAIASISRYLIVILGSIAGLGLLGMRWSQLQWMAAALTVGLGFGLQEIFANFVSGLILLFERTFRVGDTITIGEFTGTVSRIRTRATTLIDSDNKEIMVPNKAFITDRLINWTLSDTRTRVIIRIGVAYGTDIALVHRLLLQAAEEHPLVVKEPPPRTWFMAFGASTLDFELRVFVDQLLDRLPVTNDLNTRIAELFDAAKIEVAYPQMDVRVRDLGPWMPQQAAEGLGPRA